MYSGFKCFVGSILCKHLIPDCGLLIHLLVTFGEQKILTLIKSNLGSFPVKFAFCVLSKKSVPTSRLWSCSSSSTCSSERFIVLAFTLRAVIHLKFSLTQVTLDKPSVTPCFKHLGDGSCPRMSTAGTWSLAGRTMAASLSSHHPGTYVKCRLSFRQIAFLPSGVKTDKTDP